MIERLIKFTTIIFFLLLPLYFLPLSQYGVETDKQALLIFTTLLFFLFWIIKTFKEKKFHLIRTPFDSIFLLLSFIFLASTIFSAPNKIDSLIHPMGSATIVFLTFFYFLLNQFTPLKLGIIIAPLLISSSLVSLLIIIAQFVSINFHPLGDSFTVLLFFTPLIVYTLVDLLLHLRSHLVFKKLIVKITPFILFLSTAIISLYRLFTDQKILVLPLSFGWSIMLEMYKNLSYFILGVGPGNFQYAFSLGKPASINQTDFWNLITSFSSSFLLTLATEVGVIAALLFIVITIKILRLWTSKLNISKPYLLSLITSLILQIILPGNISLLILTFILLAAVVPKWESKKISVSPILPISLIGLIGLIFYLQTRFYLSDIAFRLIPQTLNNQTFQDADLYLKKAAGFNPSSHQIYAAAGALNWQLANLALSDNTATDSAQNALNYFQNAISQTNQAIKLNSKNSQYYGQLARIYQSLIGRVTDAEKWVLDAYIEQIALEPNSPQPKVALGTAFITMRQYDNAYFYLVEAVNLKPDWNNAHYNLANLYYQSGNFPKTAAELQNTLNLTPADSSDYQRVKSELEQINSLITTAATQSATRSATP